MKRENVRLQKTKTTNGSNGNKAPMAHDAEVGRRIRAQRVALAMSQTALADELGVTFQQVQKYEKGVNRVGAGRLAKIAEVLKVTPSYFFNSSKHTENPEVLGLIRTEGAARLLRAYSGMKPKARVSLLTIAEEMRS